MGRTQEKLILSDVDGCILDWSDQFHRWMAYKGHQRQEPDMPVYYQETQYGLSRMEARRQVSEFLGAAWMMGWPAYKDARQGVARLVEAGYRFHAITAIDDDPYVTQLRMMNLQDLFGKDAFVELTCVGFDADKTHALEPYRDSGFYWCEDKIENAVLGADMGLNSILLEHLYSKDFQDNRIKKVSITLLREYIIKLSFIVISWVLSSSQPSQ